MADEHSCPRCGANLPADATSTLCPRCLLKLVLDSPTTEPSSAPLPAGPLIEGRQFGGYRIVRLLGKGGMGVVYEAEQQNPKRAVALKIIRGDGFIDEDAVKRFQREVQTLARLKHPGIAAIYESGRTEDGRHFFAMELVRGPTLAEWLKTRKVLAGNRTREIEFRLALFKKICAPLVYAHNRGVIHRDLKPSNILVVDEDSGGSGPGEAEIKILDFGLARITDSDLALSTTVTNAGMVAGTLPYMSPEQARGETDEIDARTDVYALGVILYELLTGSLPYELGRAAIHEMVRVICEEPPRTLSSTWVRSRKPDQDLETIVGKTLEKGRSRRYQNVLALLEDVDRYLTGRPILARAPSTAYQARKLVLRHRVGFSFAVTVVGLVLAFAVTMAIQAQRIARERDRARIEAEILSLEAEAVIGLLLGDGATETGYALLRQALDLHRRLLGNDDPELATHLFKVAAVMEWPFPNDAEAAEAEQLLREALAILRSSVSGDDRLLMETLVSLAEIVTRTQGPVDTPPPPRPLISPVTYVTDIAARDYEPSPNLEEGETLSREALELATNYFPDKFVGVANNLRDVLSKRGQEAFDNADYESASGFWQEASALALPANLPGDEIIRAEGALVDALAMSGRYEEAENLALSTYSRLDDVEQLTTRRQLERSTLERLIALYEVWGRPDEAADYETRLAGTQ